MKKTTAYARKRAHLAIDPKASARLNHPVSVAYISNMFAKRMQKMHTAAALHTYTGHDARTICDLIGAEAYIVLLGAAANGLADTPDARIVLGTAHALFDLHQNPEALERQRPSILAGVQALDRLQAQIHPLELAAAQMEMERIVTTGGAIHIADLHDLRAANHTARPASQSAMTSEQAIRNVVAITHTIDTHKTQRARMAAHA